MINSIDSVIVNGNSKAEMSATYNIGLCSVFATKNTTNGEVI